MRRTIYSSRLDPNPCAAGFALLEVLVSLVILAMALTACMRAFTQSLSAARTAEQLAQAQYLGDQLLNRFEVNPPPLGDSDGDFGDDNPHYTYHATVDLEAPKYSDLPDSADKIDQFFMTRLLSVDIYYEDDDHPQARVLHLDSALTGIEKYSTATKQSYYIY